MGIKQIIINLLAISLFAASIYLLNQQLTQKYATHHTQITLMRAIGSGQALDETQINALRDIVRSADNKSTYGISCFFDAYEDQVLRKEISIESMFNLFADSSAQYEGITDCSHYASVLLYRSFQEQEAVKDSVRGHLLDLQLKDIEAKYPKEGNRNQICLYFNSHNTQTTIKAQFQHLTTQIYQNSVIVIEEDASTDNSPMLIKYLMDSNPSKVKFTQSKEKKGALKGLKEALEQCSEESIVVLLEDNEAMLGDIAFNIIDRIASNVDADLLFFGTLTTPYLNIENIKNNKSLHSQANPLVAIRKSTLSGLTWPETVAADIERSTLIYELVRQKQLSVAVIDQAVIYREERKNVAYFDRLYRLSALWQSK